ncbi:Utp8 family-domain-containing protein, partial [Myxozyma melibiosi]
MSTISQPFTVYSLPAISGLNKTTSFHVSAPKSTTVDLSISAAGISRFTLRPAPRLVSSVAISPLAEILCPVIVLDKASKNAATEGVTIYAAIRERKRTVFLRRIEENGVVCELELGTLAVSALKLVNDNVIIVVFVNGQISAYQFTETEISAGNDADDDMKLDGNDEENEEKEGEEKEEESPAEIKREFKHLWTTKPYDSKDNEVLFFDFSSSSEADISLLLVCRSSPDTVDVRKFSVSVSDSVQSDQWNLVLRKQSNELIQYHESGVLFFLSGGSLEIITIPALSHTSVDLVSFLTPKSGKKKNSVLTDHLSFLPSGKTSILLSTGTSLMLINWQYKTILASLDLSSADTGDSAGFKLLKRVGKRTAIGVSKSGLVQAVSFVVGSGKLLECITGSVKAVPKAGAEKPVLADILFNRETSSKKYKDLAQEAFSMSSAEFQKVAPQIKTLRSNGDVSGFDNRVFLYLSNQERWYDLNKTPPNVKETSVLASLPYYDPTTSLQVDASLIELITQSIFTLDESAKGVKLYTSFVPRLTLGFILSHPLLPIEKLPGLLPALSEYDAKLLLTALHLTTMLPVSELVAVLFAFLEKKSEIDDELRTEVIEQTIVRIEQDFSYQATVKTISSEYNSSEIQSALEDLLDLITSLSSSSLSDSDDEGYEFDAWQIISCFVDASGLFTLQEDLISRISSLVGTQIEDLQGRIEVLEIVDSALELSQTKKAARKSKKFAGVPAIRAR